ESIRFDTVGSGFDTILAVYATNASGVFALIGATDNPNTGYLDSSGGYLESRLNLANVVVGRIYFICVDGYNPGSGAASGPVVLNWNQLVGAPPNNAFGSPIDLVGMQGGVSSRNHNATKENNEPAHAGNAGGHSVWFRWVAPASGDMVIDTMGSTFDTLLAVYTGTSLSGLAATVVAQNDDAVSLDSNGDGVVDTAFIFFSRVAFHVTGGTTYRIAVDGNSAVTGSISLHYYFASTPPANDHFTNAIVLTGAKGQIASSNLGATSQAGEPSHATSAGGRSVWFRWIAPASGQVTFDTFGPHFDSVLAAYTGGALDTLTNVAVNDDVVAGVVELSRLSFAATAGTAYHIAVDGWASPGTNADFNPFKLNWELALMAPTNDLFAHARFLPGNSGTLVTSNNNAVFEQFEPLHGPLSGKSLWFKWTAGHSGGATVNTLGTYFDTLLGVYTGPDFFNLITITNNDDMDSFTNASAATFAAVAGTTYYIAIDGFNPGNGRGAENGVIILNWNQSGPPANDDFANALGLSGAAGSIDGSSREATIEAGEPDRGTLLAASSSWHRWVAPVTGSVTFDTVGSAVDTVLAVYLGNDLPSLFEVGSNDNIDDTIPVLQSRVTFRAVAGQAYQIAVDGARGAEGAFKLNWAPHALLQPSVQGSHLRVTLNVAEAGLYQLQQSTNLVNWTDLQPINASSNAVTIDLGPVTGIPRRFYRVRQ
ncbi:MAG: hypothetical protein QOF48_1498, partial [Verrucomicrobiota bacterium]